MLLNLQCYNIPVHDRHKIAKNNAIRAYFNKSLSSKISIPNRVRHGQEYGLYRNVRQFLIMSVQMSNNILPYICDIY